MIYILIIGILSNDPRHAAVAGIEFNSLPACQAAAKEWGKQNVAITERKPILICAAKGVK